MNVQVAMMNQQQQQLNMNQSMLNMSRMNPQVTNQNTHFTHIPVISKRNHSINSRRPMVPMNRSYGMWGQQFQTPNLSSDAMRPPPSAFHKALGPRSNWKGKSVNKQIGGKRRMKQHQQSLITSGGGGNLNFKNYNPPSLNELQHQNRMKTRKTFPKKKFIKNMNTNMNLNMNMTGNGGRSAPFAPRNTTSFLIRAKKSGGIAPVVSPSPVTPSVLATPILSPSTEVLGNMAKEEWGVDGYGSMKGLIRLRSQGNEDEGSGSSESDVEDHVEVERRLDHDLSRFEMIYDPNSGNNHQNVLENRVDDQDTHIAQLEEENLNLKERLFLMEGELGDLRRRLLLLERQGGREGEGEDDGGEKIVENESENGRESNGENTHSTGENGNDEEDKCDGGFEEDNSDGKLGSGDEGMKMSDDSYANDVITEDEKLENVDGCMEAHKCGVDVGSEVEITENVDYQSCKLVVATDACMLDSEVTKEEKLGC